MIRARCETNKQRLSHDRPCAKAPTTAFERQELVDGTLRLVADYAAWVRSVQAHFDDLKFVNADFVNFEFARGPADVAKDPIIVQLEQCSGRVISPAPNDSNRFKKFRIEF